MASRSLLCMAKGVRLYRWFTTGPPKINPEDILSQSLGNKGIVILNRPKYHNSLNIYHVLRLREIMTSWDNKVLVIFKGAGDKAFCSGGDIKAALSPSGPSWSDFQREAYINVYMHDNYKVPTVSFMNGIAMGGGAATCIFSRYNVATEKTIFAMPEGAVGFVPDVGSSYFLSRLQSNLGVYLALTGDRLFGADLTRCGLATHYCKSSYLPQLEEALLNEKVTEPRHIEDVLKEFTDKSPMEESKINAYIKIVEECFSDDVTLEDAVKRLESKSAHNIVNKLKSLAPLTLKIIKKQMENGKKLNLADCLKMEYRLNFKLVKHPNFQEGVKTLLVDKNKKPNWMPATLEEVTSEMVDKFFEPLEPDQELQLPL